MAANVTIDPARLSDVWAFERMRPEDAAEVMAAAGHSPVEAIIESWAMSKEAWTARIDGEVACMFGVCLHPAGSELAPVGVAWLLTTNVVDKHPKTFYKHSKIVVERLVKEYGVLLNYMDARYQKAISWAMRLGFTVHPAVPVGVNGEHFHLIVKGG